MYELAQIAQPSPRPASSQPSGTISSVLTVIGRMEEAIEAETTAIRGDPAFDIKASNARKSRYLYELNRAARGVEFGIDEHLRAALTRLRGKLDANEAALKAHLSAVGEVAALLQDAIERSEADGTYSAGAFAGSGGV